MTSPGSAIGAMIGCGEPNGRDERIETIRGDGEFFFNKTILNGNLSPFRDHQSADVNVNSEVI